MQIYQSDFCSIPSVGRASAKVRRMTKRNLKKWLLRELNKAYDLARV